MKALFVSLLLLTSHANAESLGVFGPLEIFGDSGIEGPPYFEIQNEMKDLAKKHHNLVTYIEYGESIEGQKLSLVKIERPGTKVISSSGSDQENGSSRRNAILISGATHGNEYLNIVDRLPEWFVENSEIGNVKTYLDEGGVLYIIPILNPDGYDQDMRQNRNYVDLNRDFDLPPIGHKGFHQPETKALAEYVDKEVTANKLNLRVTMDYHCCIGAWLFPWSYRNVRVPEPSLSKYLEITNAGIDIFGPDYSAGTTYEILGYTAEGTSKDYYYAKYGAAAITYEGEYGVEDKKLREHTIKWDRILGFY